MSNQFRVFVSLAAVVIAFQNCSSEEMATFKFGESGAQTDNSSLGLDLGGPGSAATPTPLPPLPTPPALPTPPPVPTPTPPPVAAAFRCNAPFNNGGGTIRADCFSNTARFDIRQLELYAASTAYADPRYLRADIRTTCLLKTNEGPHQESHATKVAGFPIEWHCNYRGVNRVENTRPTGFRTEHLNSPFRATAGTLAVVHSDPMVVGDGSYEQPPPKSVGVSDRIIYFNNETFLPATVVQDAIAEANLSRRVGVPYPGNSGGAAWSYDFTATCALGTVVRLNYTVQVLRCSYSNPVLVPPVMDFGG